MLELNFNDLSAQVQQKYISKMFHWVRFRSKSDVKLNSNNIKKYFPQLNLNLPYYYWMIAESAFHIL